MPGEFYIEGRKEQTSLADIKNILNEIKAHQTISIDFWSFPAEEIQVGSAGITILLPDIEIAGLPSVAVVQRAVAMFKFRIIENTNAASNNLDGTTVPGVSQVIQVKLETANDWHDAINFADGQFTLEGQTREAGDVCIGSPDTASVVVTNGTYQLRWLNAKSVADYLNFNDVQVGLRVWYLPGPVQGA